MNPLRLVSKKRAFTMAAIAAMALAGCFETPFCHEIDEHDPTLEQLKFKTSEEALGKTPTPTASATAAATSAATGTASPTTTATTATATSTATPLAAPGASASLTPVPGADRPQTVRLRANFGVDHPPFARNYGVGGASVGLACVSGIPAGGIIVIRIGGGTGAPASVTGTDATGSGLVIPFPIEQYGTMDGSITSLMVNGPPVDFTADPFSYSVGEAERICTPLP